MDLISEHPTDIADGAVLKLWRYRLAEDERDTAHRHEWAQLDWSPTGVLTVDVDGRSWVVPPTVAMWVPAHQRHAVGASRAADLWPVTSYPRTDGRLSNSPFDCAVPVAMTRLMIELLNRLNDDGLTRESRGRVGEVFIDAMSPAHGSTFELPLPRDERAAAITCSLMRHPADDRSLSKWGRTVGASRRTLVRIFTSETGLTFTEWRKRCRIRATLPQLARGATVTAAAHDAGYRSASAYVAAFHHTVGITPGEYQRQVIPSPGNRLR